MSVVAAAVIGSTVIGSITADNAADAAADSQERAVNAQERIANRQSQLAEDQWNRYLHTYGPLEDAFISESRDFGSEGNRGKAATEAAGSVASSYAGLRQRLASTPGLDPSSRQYLDVLSKIGVQEAAQSAAAQTGARDRVSAEGRARMTDALSLGKGLAANATSALASAAGSYGGLAAAAAARGQAATQQAGAVGQMVGGLFSNPTVQSGIGKAGAALSEWWNAPSIQTGPGATGSVPGGYEGAGTTYNNPSAWMAG